MKQLLSLFFILFVCSCAPQNKQKDVKQENNLPDVSGCFGLKLNQTTKAEAKKILNDYSETYSITPYRLNKLGYDGKLLVHDSLQYYEVSDEKRYGVSLQLVFINDTLYQIFIHDRNLASIRNNLVEKYGDGYRDEYMNHHWFNDTIRIDDNLLPFLNDSIFKTETYDIVYTYIPAIPRIKKFLNESFNNYKKEKEYEHQKDLDNI